MISTRILDVSNLAKVPPNRSLVCGGSKGIALLCFGATSEPRTSTRSRKGLHAAAGPQGSRVTDAAPPRRNGPGAAPVILVHGLGRKFQEIPNSACLREG